jgi:hypothetical protein
VVPTNSGDDSPPDDTRMFALTTNTFLNDDYPTWSPDDSNIAFVSAGSIYITPSNGSESPRLIYSPTYYDAKDLAWSPVANKILYSARTFSNNSDDIYLLDLNDPNHPIQLTDDSAEDRTPVWSADGLHIVFSSNRLLDENDTLENYNIFIMDADGNFLRSLTTDRAGDDIQPALSSDGTEVAFTSYFPYYQDFPVSDTSVSFKIYRSVLAGTEGFAGTASVRPNLASSQSELNSLSLVRLFVNWANASWQGVVSQVPPPPTPTPTPEPTLTPTPSPTPDFYVSCRLDDVLNVRKEPSLRPLLDDGSDNRLTALSGGTPIFRSGPDVEPPYMDQNGYQYTFVPVQYGDVTGYVARLKTNPSTGFILQYLYSNLQDAGCPAVPIPPTYNPNDQYRSTYYEEFKGLAFWVIYNETSEGSMIDRFDIVNDVLSTNDIRPNGIDPQSILGELSLDGFHRYLFARTLLDGTPEFDSDFGAHYGQTFAEYTPKLFEDGYSNAKIWGGSIGDPKNSRLWLTVPACLSNGTYGDAVASGDAKAVLDWLTNYALCRNIHDGSKFQHAFSAIMPYVELAIQHKVAEQQYPNPISGATQVRNANTCYVWSTDGACRSNSNAISDLYSFCSDTGCAEQVYDPEGNTVPGQVPSILPSGAVSQQLVYATTQGFTYSSLLFGLYQYSPIHQHYFLITDPAELVATQRPNSSLSRDDLKATFELHWARLNRDQNPPNAPSTFRPAFCLTGTSHVLQISYIWTTGNPSESPTDTGYRTWYTFTFANGNIPSSLIGDFWFCN